MLISCHRAWAFTTNRMFLTRASGPDSALSQDSKLPAKHVVSALTSLRCQHRSCPKVWIDDWIHTASLRWSIPRQWVNSWCPWWISKRLRHCLFKPPVAWLAVAACSVQCGLRGKSNPLLYGGNSHVQTKSCELARIRSQTRIADSAVKSGWYTVYIRHFSHILR